jgi:hypothetical protein
MINRKMYGDDGMGDTYRYSSMDTRFGAPFEGDDDGDGQK